MLPSPPKSNLGECRYFSLSSRATCKLVENLVDGILIGAVDGAVEIPSQKGAWARARIKGYIVGTFPLITS